MSISKVFSGEEAGPPGGAALMFSIAASGQKKSDGDSGGIVGCFVCKSGRVKKGIEV